MQDAVVVVKEEGDKLKQHDTFAGGRRKGLVRGAVLGLLLGVATGGVGLVLAAGGAVVGRALGSRSGDLKAMAQEVRESLAVGQAALCALVADANWSEVRERFAYLGGETMLAEVSPEAMAEVEALLAQETEDVAAQADT